MIRYICKYTPVELIKSFGLDAVLYNPAVGNHDIADRLTHRNMCSFSRALITRAAEKNRKAGSDMDGIDNADSDIIVLTDCCDSIRRANDVLDSLGVRTAMLSLPRRRDECGVSMYKKELMRFAGILEDMTGRTFNREAFRSAFRAAEPPDGAYISVMGARMGDELMDEIRKTSPYRIRNNTCTGLRRLGMPPRIKASDGEAEGLMERTMEWYSEELLSLPACMRMIDISGRRALTEDPNLMGVIYNTVKFCDFYSFEYAALRDALKVPMLKIETDYTEQGTGQIGTRLQAFFEEFRSPASSASLSHAHSAAYPAAASDAGPNACSGKKGYFAGIDSGSTSTNAVIIDGRGNIISFCTLLTGVNVAQSAGKALREALRKAGLDAEQIRSTVTTGYGRAGIAFRERDVTEITCHAKGAHFLNAGVRTVIDIGGQDSKIIRLDERGGVKDFAMNDKCAAGTGRFLEMMAHSLDLTLEEMSKMGLKSGEEIIISSMCSVFAQSEVVSLIAAGKRPEDIVRGLNRSVAAKVTALAGRSGLEKEWMMTGGVAKNPGIVAAIEERLGGKVVLPDEPEICGALGAALIAAEEAR